MPKPRIKTADSKIDDSKIDDSKIIGGLTPSQRYAILLLSANNFEPVRGELWYQKELFLLSKNINKLGESTDFAADYMGPYSETAKEEYTELKMCEILENEDYKIKLTSFGKKVASLLEKDITQEEIKIISELKSLLNDMSRDELLCLIYFTYPEMRTESVLFERINRKKKELVFSLYKKGKISLGKASEILETPIVTLMAELEKQGAMVYSD